MMFIIGVIVLIVGLAAFSAWLEKRKAKASEFGIPVETKEVPADPVKVTVTYNDGTTEVFNKNDGEIEYQEGGALIIRLEGRCITVSPFSYHKVEELHV